MTAGEKPVAIPGLYAPISQDHRGILSQVLETSEGPGWKRNLHLAQPARSSLAYGNCLTSGVTRL